MPCLLLVKILQVVTFMRQNMQPKCKTLENCIIWVANPFWILYHLCVIFTGPWTYLKSIFMHELIIFFFFKKYFRFLNVIKYISMSMLTNQLNWLDKLAKIGHLALKSVVFKHKIAICMFNSKEYAHDCLYTLSYLQLHFRKFLFSPKYHTVSTND